MNNGDKTCCALLADGKTRCNVPIPDEDEICARHCEELEFHLDRLSKEQHGSRN